MLTALLVDDDRLARVALRSSLEESALVAVVAESADIDTAARWLARHEVDIVFLDIDLRGRSGFELFEVPVRAAVVFVTAYDAFAVKAFEVDALDYLLKPVAPDDVARVVERFRRHRPMAGLVPVGTASSVRLVPMVEIQMVTAAGDYTEVQLDNGDVVLSSSSMGSWERRLPAHAFQRVHRRHIVNGAVVEALRRRGGRWQIVLRSGAVIPVSRRMVSAVKVRWGPT